jgi:hypothetical protein
VVKSAAIYLTMIYDTPELPMARYLPGRSFVIERSKLHRLAECQRSLQVGRYEPALFGSNGSVSHWSSVSH